MRVLIIGAGFVGVELADQLLAAGHEVFVYDVICTTERKGLSASIVDVINDDLSFPYAIDAVYYLAQSPYYRNFPEHSEHLFGVNTYGAIKAAECARKAGAKFFFYASTGNVYTPSFCKLCENSKLDRQSPYALSKIMAEESLSLYRSQMTIVCGRFFGVFGKGQKNMLAAQINQKVQSGEPIYLYPANESDIEGLKISLIFNKDLTRILARLMEYSFGGVDLPFVMNIAGANPVSLRQFAIEIGKATNKSPVFHVESEMRHNDLVGDVTLLNARLAPHYTLLEDAVRESYQTVY